MVRKSFSLYVTQSYIADPISDVREGMKGTGRQLCESNNIITSLLFQECFRIFCGIKSPRECLLEYELQISKDQRRRKKV